MKLQNFVIGALMVATITVGLTSFISTGLTEYGVQSNVDQKNFEKLERMENATSITTKAKDRAANVESKSNYFNLPGVVKTGKLVFDALGLWSIFIQTIMEITGLNQAPRAWPAMLATGAIGISVSFIFVKRWF